MIALFSVIIIASSTVYNNLIENILLQIQKEGLLSYTDFCFLMNILATPRRYLDVAFLAFDISGDGNVEAKVS